MAWGSGQRFRLEPYGLEPHVRDALQKAVALAADGPLTARHLLMGASLEVARGSKSRAFVRLGELLPMHVKTVGTQVERSNLAWILLVDELHASFVTAQNFLNDKKGQVIWGRDYVTIALLAKDDPSLDDIARETGKNIAEVRDSWLAFVRASKERREPEEWDKWWHAAGFNSQTPPGQRSSPVPLDLAMYDLSRGATRILQASIERIRTNPKATAVSTTSVLLEMAEVGSPVSDPQWIADFLRRTVAAFGQEYAAVVRDHLWQSTGSGENPERKATLMMPGLAWSLERAQDIARRTTGAATIAGRHLLAGLIIEPPAPYALGAHQRLIEIGIDIPLLREQLYEWVRGYGDDDAVWRAVLVGAGPQPRRRPEFDADRTTGPDLLDIQQDVVALATLIAARDSVPPLSVGLFGDWGSGKTFFMEKLRHMVAQLSDEARKANIMQRDLPFYKHIVQIEFNAWHYTEGNLWASMVEHILANLRKDDGQPATLTEALQEHCVGSGNFGGSRSGNFGG